MDQLPAFKVRTFEESSKLVDIVVLGRMPEEEAIAIAQDSADLWKRKVALAVVPDIDRGSSLDWRDDEIEVFMTLHGHPASPAERHKILRRCQAWRTDEGFEAMQSCWAQDPRHGA